MLTLINFAMFASVSFITALSTSAQTKQELPDTTQQTFAFRHTNWGMTRKVVQESEVETECLLPKNDESLCYMSTASELSCMVYYYFAENRLVKAEYVFIEPHTNGDLYVRDYEQVKRDIASKYGQALKDTVVWTENLGLFDKKMRRDPKNIGPAVFIGELRYESVWELPETKIRLSLGGDALNVRMLVEYVSKSLAPLYEQQKVKKAREDY